MQITGQINFTLKNNKVNLLTIYYIKVNYLYVWTRSNFPGTDFNSLRFKILSEGTELLSFNYIVSYRERTLNDVVISVTTDP